MQTIGLRLPATGKAVMYLLKGWCPFSSMGTAVIRANVRLVFVGLLIASWGTTPRTVFAQDESARSKESSEIALAESEPTTSGVPQGADVSVRIGLKGRYRLGQWTAVRVPASGDWNQAVDVTLETPDGDGVSVAYVHPLDADSRWAYVIPGREGATLLATSTELELETRFPILGSPAKEPSLVPVDMPWIVAIGDTLGVEKVGSNELLGRDASVAVSRIESFDELPDQSIGYSGVDLLMINADGIPVLESLRPQQRTALADWIAIDGGHVFVNLGTSAVELLRAAPWLVEGLPIDVARAKVVELDPAALETFTSSQDPLQPFDGLVLPTESGESLITGRTARRLSARFAVRYVRGFGRVTVLAADLDDSLFAEWPDRLDLLKRLLPSVLVQDQEAAKSTQRVAGFDDLAGQARMALDHFSIRRPFGFSLLSVLILVLILLVGPIDYWLINRVFGKPLLGWLTLPLMAISLSVFLVLQSREGHVSVNVGSLVNRESPHESQEDTSAAAGIESRADAVGPIAWNRFQISDLDLVSGVGRGFDWSGFYSHRGGRFDVQSVPTETMMRLSGSPIRSRTRPFGFAGRAFGGIQIEADTGLPMYGVVMGGAETPGSRLDGVPIAPRSSKSIATSFLFRMEPTDEFFVRRRGGSDLLRGGLTNPLPVDLLDGMLVYRNWAYRLPTRLRAGAKIASLAELRQENFRWYLTRQKAIESSSDVQPWDPTEKDDLSRIVEMLMFHQVVGGRRYTGLGDGPLAKLDMTSLLGKDRCILIGELEEPLSNARFSISDDSNDPATGEPVSLGAAGEFVRPAALSAGSVDENRSRAIEVAPERDVNIVRVMIPVIAE